MKDFSPVRELPKTADYSSDDVLVIFGEVFDRGYVNGLIQAAEKKNMKVIYGTVGRREKDNTLRSLNETEIQEKNQNNLINIPLEAGFDLEPNKDGGQAPVEQLQGVKMSAWDSINLNFENIEQSRLRGIERFRKNSSQFLSEVGNHINEKSNVLFAHTMAGGFPRAKVVMPAANRVFKGFDERYASSEHFWNSDIGKLCDISFNEVTANTLQHLIDLSTPIREKQESLGKNVAYVAYGYHGTEVLLEGEYTWQSYSPYLQGWAKRLLEDIASDNFKKGINVSVYNAPEILTNSSSIFLGVEVALYPLMLALQKEGKDSTLTADLITKCGNLLSEEAEVHSVVERCQQFLSQSVANKWCRFDDWPQHNGPEQMKAMRETSNEVISLHKDSKSLMTSELSEIVFQSCGEIMLNQSQQKEKPVWWIGHDAVAKQALANS